MFRIQPDVRLIAGILAAAVLTCLSVSVPQQRESSAGWPCYGGDPGGTRYSTAAQINRENVKDLKVTWVYHAGEDWKKGASGQRAAFEATPILFNGVLYVSTPFSRVIALDPVSGKERWTYDPQVDPSIGYSEVTSRGVSAWADPERTGSGSCRERIFLGTLDARLIALNAATGVPCKDFGENGQIDLTRDVGLVDRGDYQVTSPPAVIAGLVVVGSSMGDNRGVELERGVVRAFDARTGKLRWSWDPIPRDPGDPARKTWEGNSAAKTGAANVWSVISADPERGLLFVPTSSPSPDFYGGERRGSNVYANSIVALRAATGKPVWHFQVVHHDLWDYDVASQPALINIKRGGETVPAVAVATKMGHLFVLHRETGKPLFPVEERPVPKTTVPGEESWPTQPFPSLPRALAPQKLSSEEAWGPTDKDRDWCRERIKASRSEVIFTPPSLEGTIIFPGNAGGMHWGSISWDPQRALIIANTNRLAFWVKLIPREQFNQLRASGEGNRMSGEFGRQSGTPYAMYREILRSPGGTPCNPPPWGALTAVNLATGEVTWEVPLGSIPQFAGTSNASESWGSVNFGGSIVTRGGLIFIAAAMDTYLRAFDIETGRILWKGELPASAQATPMTYQGGPNGKQFVVIAAGGHGKLGTKKGDAIVAFALP